MERTPIAEGAAAGAVASPPSSSPPSLLTLEGSDLVHRLARTAARRRGLADGSDEDLAQGLLLEALSRPGFQAQYLAKPPASARAWLRAALDNRALRMAEDEARRRIATDAARERHREADDDGPARKDLVDELERLADDHDLPPRLRATLRHAFDRSRDATPRGRASRLRHVRRIIAKAIAGTLFDAPAPRPMRRWWAEAAAARERGEPIAAIAEAHGKGRSTVFGALARRRERGLPTPLRQRDLPRRPPPPSRAPRPRVARPERAWWAEADALVEAGMPFAEVAALHGRHVRSVH